MDNTSLPDKQSVVSLEQGSGDTFYRALVNVTMLLCFLLALCLLVLRELVIPRVQDYVPQVESALGRAIGMPVRIEALSADWQGVRPRFHVRGLSVVGAQEEVLFGFDEVHATLGWASVIYWQAHFHRLVIHSPRVALHREIDGRLKLGDMGLGRERVPETQAVSGMLAWVLAQREVLILGASMQWLDWSRSPEPLYVHQFDLRFSSGFGRHRFGVRVAAVTDLWQGLELRGEFDGVDSLERASWNGRLYLAADELDFSALQFWLDLPEMPGGYGNLRAWLDVSDGSMQALDLDIALTELAFRLAPSQPRLQLTDIDGRISVSNLDRFTLSLGGLSFTPPDGGRFGPFVLDLSSDVGFDRLAEGASVSFDRLDLAQTARLASHLPLPATAREWIAQADLSGVMKNVLVDWRRGSDVGDQWQLRAMFDGVSSQAVGPLPGFAGLTGLVEGNSDRGRFLISGQDASLSLPTVFPDPVIPLEEISGEGGWLFREGSYEIVLDEAYFANRDATGTVSGSYRAGVGQQGDIDLVAHLAYADGAAVPRYLPSVLNPAARDWLTSALGGGTITDARLRLRGALDHFPFDDGESGQFLVTAHVAGLDLDYAQGWPAIGNIDGHLRFEGRGMRIEVERASLMGVTLEDVLAEIPVLGAAEGELLSISGLARGATADFLRFIAQSPVRSVAGAFTDGIRANGSGELKLELGLPIRDLSTARINGEYGFSANRLNLLAGLPEVTEARGRVRFSERSFEIPEASGRMLGEALSVRASISEEGRTRFRAEGGATVRGLREHHDWPWLAHLSGGTGWSADIDVVEAGVDVRVETSLAGLSSSLPQPLNKRAAEPWPSVFEMRVRERGATRSFALDLGGRGSLLLALSGQGDAMRLSRGGLAWGRPLDTIGEGIKIVAAMDELDVDAWRREFLYGNNGSDAWLMALLSKGAVDLSIARLGVFGQEFRDAALDALFDQWGWRGQVRSDRVAGGFDWRSANGGVLEARLARLVLGQSGTPETRAGAPEQIVEPLRSLPALDVVAEDFVLRGRSLGRLILEARNDNPFWRLERLEIANDSDRLRGSGRWLAGSDLLTELNFNLQSSDVGALLGRVGYPDIVNRGRAHLDGRLNWQGTPLRLHYPSLSGEFELNVTDGQFRQLEPGVGRLLGVLSLQALPRRLSLDFRDVFSEGFAFERVSGSIDMDRGVMSTEDLRIEGPAARIWVSGQADLNRETQDLRVIVQPTLSESIAVGAAAGLINPVAGVVALLAQRIMADPIERMFAYTYHIAGNWADPKVEKLIGATRGTDGTQERVQ